LTTPTSVDLNHEASRLENSGACVNRKHVILGTVARNNARRAHQDDREPCPCPEDINCIPDRKELGKYPGEAPPDQVRTRHTRKKETEGKVASMTQESVDVQEVDAEEMD
jgi:hypothetical protein